MDNCKKPLVIRNSVKSKLDNVMNYPLTVVYGGVGFGKTTAINEFMKNHDDLVFVEISLFNSKDSLDYFWNRFAQGVKMHDENLGEFIEKIGYPTNIQEIMKVLDFCRENMDEKYKTVVIIDDYQNSHDPIINMIFETFMKYPIENLSIIIISRNIPTFCLSDFQSKGVCQIINNKDLLFTIDETKKYIELSGLKLSGAEIKKIQEQTDGWITAIYLIIERIKNNLNTDDMVTISSLIETTIYNNYDADTQEFLLKLSYLNDFTAEEAVYVLEDDNAAKKIIMLENDNFFIEYNNKTKKFKLHNLFKKFLQDQSEKIGFEHNIINNRAGDYYSNINFLTAMDFYLKCNNYNSILKCIEEDSSTFLNNIEINTLQLIWENNSNFIYQYPIAAIKFCWQELSYGYVTNTKTIIENLEQFFIVNNSNVRNDAKYEACQVKGEIYITKAFLENLSNEKAHNYINLSKKFFGQKKSLIYCDHWKFSFGSPSLLMIYLHKFKTKNDFYSIVDTTLKDFKCVADSCGEGCEEIFKGEYHLFKLELDLAKRFTEQAIVIASAYKNELLILCGCFNLVRISIAYGDFEKAFEILLYYKRKFKYSKSPLFKNGMDIIMGYLGCMTGHIEKVPGWILNKEAQSNLLKKTSYVAELINCRILIFNGDYVNGEVICEHRIFELEAENHSLIVAYHKIYLAICKYYLGKQQEAENIIIDIIKKIIIKYKFYLPFIENSIYLLELLNSIVINPLYENVKIPVKEVYDKCLEFYNIIPRENKYIIQKRMSKSPILSYIGRTDIVKQSPLSDREREVVSLLAKGLTREEISKRLFLSQSTIKTYLNNIYKKYGVNNKVSAITAAKEEGII